MGWDGATLSPRLFSGAVHYYTSDKVLDLGDGVELLPEGIVRYVFLCACGLLRRCSLGREVGIVELATMSSSYCVHCRLNIQSNLLLTPISLSSLSTIYLIPNNIQ